MTWLRFLSLFSFFLSYIFSLFYWTWFVQFFFYHTLKIQQPAAANFFCGCGMAGRSRRAWFSVLLGLVVGFTLASRLILPKASELKKAGQKRKANPAGCALNAALRKELGGGAQWPPQDNGSPATEKPGSGSSDFLFVGVMTAQKYLNNRAVAAHR